MAEQMDNSGCDLLTQEGPATPGQHALPHVAATPPIDDRMVYREAAAACLPRWLRMVGPAPWLRDAGGRKGGTGRAVGLLYKQQASAVAIGLLAESAEDRPDIALLRECVRTSLIQWQLFLGTDGRPTHRLLRRSPLQSVTAGLIIQLLNETSGFQTDLLLADIDRHIRWLISRPRQTPWIEAATICALTDGALLVRDASLLTEARRRLGVLLKQQDDEGWFPERGGADIGRLSLTVDALARILCQNAWEELTEPLSRMVNFLLHFVHPDGTIGGCYGSCGTAFLSPYGVELLAPTHPGAAALAQVCRQRYRRLTTECFSAWHDDLCTLLAPRLAMTASSAKGRIPTPSAHPHEVKPHTYFPNAGLSVHVTDAYHAVVGGKNGGALHVTFRSDAPSLEEPGITVISPLTTRTSGRWTSSTQVEQTPCSVTSRGILRRPGRDRARRWRPVRKWMRRIGFRKMRAALARTNDCEHSQATPRGLASARYCREIAFERDLIRIRDTLHTRPRCQTILCRSPAGLDSDRYVDRGEGNERHREPIFVDGGRHVEITRVYRDGRLVERPAAQVPSEPQELR